MKFTKKLKQLLNTAAFALLPLAALPARAVEGEEESVAETVAGGEFANSNIAQGTMNLVNDISVWCIVLCAVVGTAAAVYCLIRRSMADEADGKMWTRRCTTAIICAVAGALVGSIVAVISSYYGG